MAGLHVLADAVADEWRLRGAVDQRHKLVLVIFGKVFIFNLWQNKEMNQNKSKHAGSVFAVIFSTCKPCTVAR